jgi:orotidine-5'-phosphate decarboxylase
MDNLNFFKMNFISILQSAIRKNRSYLCVGLDPDPARIPEKFKKRKKPLFHFCKYIVDSTGNLAAAYKPNSAFFQAEGKVDELCLTIAYIKKVAPHIPVILDAKRGDIGNTSLQYAKYAFEYLKADAITLHAYMGFDSVEPFLRYKNKGAFILCLTSNSGSSDFQQIKTGNKFLFEAVADKAEEWNKISGNIGLVVGATKPEMLLRLRQSHPKLPFLIPGLGAQAGDLEKSVKYGTLHNSICLFNVSRSVLYPAEGQTVKQAAETVKSSIQNILHKS